MTVYIGMAVFLDVIHTLQGHAKSFKFCLYTVYVNVETMSNVIYFYSLQHMYDTHVALPRFSTTVPGTRYPVLEYYTRDVESFCVLYYISAK